MLEYVKINMFLPNEYFRKGLNKNQNHGYACRFLSFQFFIFQVCTRRNGLKKHMERYHGSASIDQVSSGNCRCLECEFRCRYITELRKHLALKHNFTFRNETRIFANMTGKNFHL